MVQIKKRSSADYGTDSNIKCASWCTLDDLVAGGDIRQKLSAGTQSLSLKAFGCGEQAIKCFI